MRPMTLLQILLLLVCTSYSQNRDKPDPDAQVKVELRNLFSSLNKAIVEKDRAGLERAYAEEFLFVHSAGKVTSRAERIQFILASDDPASRNPVSTPDLDALRVYGSVATVRTSERGVETINLFARKNGNWQIVHVQGTRLPSERKAITIDSKVRDQYVEKYEFSPGAFAVVTVEGDQLKWKGGTRPKVTLMPISENRFYTLEGGGEVTFNRAPDGSIAGATLRLGECQDSTGRRVN